jgi:hypothetical protein
MADALSLEEMNRLVAIFGASQKNFMRMEQRSSLRSALFDVPRRSSLGWIGIYQHGASLLRQLTKLVPPEEIGQRMKQLCSRPYYLQLSILMCSFFGARQQLILDRGLKPGDPLSDEDDTRIDDALFLVDFWRRVARMYRNDGCLLPAENGYTQAILPQSEVDELAAWIEPCTPEHRRSIRRLAATLDLYSFILHGEQRDGTFGHGPYPQPNGAIIVVHEYNDLCNQFLPWADTSTRNLYPNLAIVRRLRAGVDTRFDLFGSILYKTADVDRFIIGESLLTRAGDGALRQILWDEIPEIQHRAAEAQNELYVKAAGWTPRYKAEYGIYLFANHFYPFFQIAGLNPSWGETIRRSFETAVEPLVEPMLKRAEIPSIWPFMATTEGDFFWPVTRRHAPSPTTLTALKP